MTAARDITLHEMLHLFAEASLLSDHESLYQRAEVYISVKSASGECVIAVPGQENNELLQAISHAAAIGPITPAFDLATDLIKMVKANDTETLEQYLSADDMSHLSQADPTKCLLAALATKQLEKQLGIGRMHTLNQLIRKAVNQQMFPLPLHEIVPIEQAKMALRSARRQMELLDLGPRRKGGHTPKEIMRNHDINKSREYT